MLVFVQLWSEENNLCAYCIFSSELLKIVQMWIFSLGSSPSWVVLLFRYLTRTSHYLFSKIYLKHRRKRVHTLYLAYVTMLCLFRRNRWHSRVLPDPCSSHLTQQLFFAHWQPSNMPRCFSLVWELLVIREWAKNLVGVGPCEGTCCQARSDFNHWDEQGGGKSLQQAVLWALHTHTS